MSKKTNYPNPLLYGGPTHKHWDKENTSANGLAALSTFTGEWQLNTEPDVLISFNSSECVTLILQYSDDAGVNITEESIVIEGGTPGEIIRKKGSKSFRILVVNNTNTLISSLRVYTYYGDFNISSDGTIVLRGIGEGTEKNPLVQHIENHPLEDLQWEIIRELKKINLYLYLITDVHIKNTEVD